MFQFRLIGLILVVLVAIAGWVATCGAWRLEQEVALVGPLERRTFDALTLLTIGTGGVYENPERRGPSSAVGFGERIVLVDAGRAVADALRLSLIPVPQPDVVFLTSLLPENTQGLDDLLLTGWVQGRETPLRVVGPPGTAALAEGLVAAHRAGIEARAGGIGIHNDAPSFEVVEIGDGHEEEIDGLTVRAAALSGGPTEAFAYRFEADGRSLVVGGTGWDANALVDLARGANLLVHEAIFVPTADQAADLGLEESAERLAREASEHTGIEEVGGIARRSGVETLVLVRLRPPPVYDVQITGIVDDEFGGRIVIATDGDEFKP